MKCLQGNHGCRLRRAWLLSAIARADMVPNNSVARAGGYRGPRTQELAGLKLFYIYTTGRNTN
jgi:hypothetical protein